MSMQHDRLCQAAIQFALAAETPKRCMEALFMLESLIEHEEERHAMPTVPRRTVVSVVPMPITPHLELLSCGHAGKLHDSDVKHPERFIGDTRECLTCKWSPEERSHE